jgi:hypothetical protein
MYEMISINVEHAYDETNIIGKILKLNNSAARMSTSINDDDLRCYHYSSENGIELRSSSNIAEDGKKIRFSEYLDQVSSHSDFIGSEISRTIEGVSLSPPKLDVTYGSNLLAWEKCRCILHNYGFRVRFRFDIYNGKSLIRMIIPI